MTRSSRGATPACRAGRRRHDKSPEFNYVAPEIDEMAEELALVRAWFDRIKRYAND